ncbi:MAG: hypothetical protein II625_04540 [Bacilli bacterium]|nr:hypothetical protein [Bacilli bacterium]
MTIDEENRINILSKLPNELLQTKECKLEHSWINSTSTAAWRILDYHEQYDLRAIRISITHKINNSYYVVIHVYISGTCYSYFEAPRDKLYPQVDIAYQIATYLKILGLHVYDH